MQTIQDAATALASGATTARQLVEDSLARIADPAGEGARVFIKTHAAAARAAADMPASPSASKTCSTSPANPPPPAPRSSPTRRPRSPTPR
jgi:Asp-tRNA(Asn)/Glu-tRNA(Gln) amidotransferase A subunit family amidase